MVKSERSRCDDCDGDEGEHSTQGLRGKSREERVSFWTHEKDDEMKKNDCQIPFGAGECLP